MDNNYGFHFGVGLVLGVFVAGIMTMTFGFTAQYRTTLNQIKPFINLKCEMSHNEMTKDQIKFCDYYNKK